MQDEIKLRKYRDTLKINGTGILAIGIWSDVKQLMQVLYVQGSYIKSFFDEIENDNRVIIIIMVIIFVMADLLIRFHILKCANREAMGGNKGHGYIVLSAWLMIVHVLSIGSTLEKEISISPGTAAAEILLDITAAVFLLQLVIAAINVRRYRKRQG